MANQFEKFDISLLDPKGDRGKLPAPEEPMQFIETGESIKDIQNKGLSGLETDIIERAYVVVLQWNASYDTVHTDEENALIDSFDRYHRALREQRQNRIR